MKVHALIYHPKIWIFFYLATEAIGNPQDSKLVNSSLVNSLIYLLDKSLINLNSFCWKLLNRIDPNIIKYRSRIGIWEKKVVHLIISAH